MNCYKCIGTEVFLEDEQPAISVPVYEANTFCLYEDSELSKVDDDNNRVLQPQFLLENLKKLCAELKTGSLIVDTQDGDISDNIENTHRVIKTFNPETSSCTDYKILRYQYGPIHKHPSIDEISDSITLTNDSNIVLVTLTKEYTENEQFLHTSITLFFIDLKEKKWTDYSFRINNKQIGSHMFALHSSQLFICYKVPVKVFMVDFNNFEKVTLYKWSSCVMKASRFMTCSNFLIIYDSQTNPQDLLCVTFARNTTCEVLVKKPSIMLGESVESLQVVNVNGRIVLIAHKDNTLLFLTLNENQFMVLSHIDFNTSTQAMKDYVPLIVKNILCYRNSMLYIPVARMEKSFPEDNTEFSQDFIIAAINLVTFQIKYILRVNSKVNIYKEQIDFTLFNHGTIVTVKKLTKYVANNKRTITSYHVFKIFPDTLQSACLNNVLLGSSKKRQYLQSAALFVPKKVQRKIYDAFDC